jgi:ankyrin repeat protein
MNLKLLNSAVDGNADELGVLIRHGACIELRDPQLERTALILASIVGKADSVRMLLDAGADKEAKDSGGGTALILAATHGHAE